MNRPVRFAIPTITILAVASPVIWAFPVELSWWRALGIMLGWTGIGMLVTSLLLMIREPKLAEALGGLERMYRWHHGLGLSAYLALLLHPLAFAADAWVEAPTLAWQTLSPLATSWPTWTGWLSLLCLMAGLGATFSTRIAYSRWRLLHGLLGIGILVGLVHLTVLGLDALVLTTTAMVLLLLAWRALRIDLGLGALPYLVTAAHRVAATTVEITLGPLGRKLTARPGQFVMVAFRDGLRFRSCGEYHPFTVSSIAPDGTIGAGIKALGDCTMEMQSLEPGIAARIQGPFGEFLQHRTAAPELWIAGGIGVTPFIATLRDALPCQATTLLYLFRREGDAAYLDELRTLARTARTFTLMEHETGDREPDLDRLLPENDAATLQCYVCGPPGLVSAVLPALARRGMNSDRIHYERFDFR